MKHAALVILLFSVASILAIVANALHFLIKDLVRQKGYPASWWHGHFRDIRFLRQIIANESDAKKRRQYQRILYGLLVTFFLFVLAGLSGGALLN